MTAPTEAQSLREAVARVLDTWAFRYGDPDYYGPDLEKATYSARQRVALKTADAIITGPIGAHIAKIEAERDAAIAMQREPVGDTWDELRRLEGECRSLQATVNMWQKFTRERRKERDAAEAQIATLTAALDRYEPLIPSLPGIPEAMTLDRRISAIAREAIDGREGERVIAACRDAAEAQAATLTARLAEATETFTDEAGTVWSPPTAWAYFAACRALHAKTARLAEVEAAAARAKEWRTLTAELVILQARELARLDPTDIQAVMDRLRAARSALNQKDADRE